MIQTPLISIIVPVYNVEPFLAKCLDSILAQTYKNLEIIAVDDGSTDQSGSICDLYAEKYERIRVIHKENGGLASARNAGIDVARGAWLGFVDSDDYIEPEMYEKLLNAAVSNGCSLSVCGINYVFDDGKIVPKANIEPDQVFDFSHAITEMNTYRLFDMGAWSKLYKAKLFDGIRFPEGKLSEDFFIMYKLFDRAQNIAFVSDACYNYYQRKNSITKSKHINNDFLEAAYEQMLYLDKNHPSLAVVAHAAYASAALTVYDFYIKNGVLCPKTEIRKFKKIIKDNLEYIKNNTSFSSTKKIQFTIFLTSTCMYNIFFKIYRSIKRI